MPCVCVTKLYLLISPRASDAGAGAKSVAMMFILDWLGHAAGRGVGSHFLFDGRVFRMGGPNAVVSFRVQSGGEPAAARLDDPPAEHHVRKVGRVVIEQLVVVRDNENAHLLATELLAAGLGNALAGGLHGVAREPAVGLVENGKLGPEDGPLQDLGPL